jgi:hypothetical protein
VGNGSGQLPGSAGRAAFALDCDLMAKRPTSPSELREAVERTVQSTLDSTGAGLARGRKALEDARPATHEDISELKAELRKIGRRLDAIEGRLPAKRSTGKRPSSK